MVSRESSLCRLAALQRDHRDLRPDAQTTGKGQEAETTIDIKITVFVIGQPGPVEVTVLHGAPAEAGCFNPELCTMCMPR